NETLESATPISSLPGVLQHSPDSILEEVEIAVADGIKSVILFGIPETKDEEATEAYSAGGVIQTAISLIKTHFPDLIVIADCCLCEYTDHGNCYATEKGNYDHNKTLELLGDIAASYADAGVDIVAPSGMIDGKVNAIRTALDEQGHDLVSIMSYSVKFASAFYGPFRDATNASNKTFDRRHHQMNPAQRFEALREADLDVDEGADSIIVKPITHNLDLVIEVKERTELPIIGYQVSGEYSMLKQAALKGIVNEKDAFNEVFISMKRAGCSKIISYYAKEIAKTL
ncbi:porphobilinogen synthase, partial [Candidatus Marinamargulisbacteria bacterium SCGC AAA071-K20]